MYIQIQYKKYTSILIHPLQENIYITYYSHWSAHSNWFQRCVCIVPFTVCTSYINFAYFTFENLCLPQKLHHATHACGDAWDEVCTSPLSSLVPLQAGVWLLGKAQNNSVWRPSPSHYFIVAILVFIFFLFFMLTI